MLDLGKEDMLSLGKEDMLHLGREDMLHLSGEDMLHLGGEDMLHLGKGMYPIHLFWMSVHACKSGACSTQTHQASPEKTVK